MLRQSGCLSLLLSAWCGIAAAEAGPSPSRVIERMPEGYHLYAYDDCGAALRQPHVEMTGGYDAYAPAGPFLLQPLTAAERSTRYDEEIRLTYEGLDATRSYILALTYPKYERGAPRLEADGVELHGELAAPAGPRQRALVEIPESVTRDGVVRLRLRNREAAQAAIAIAELWATGEPRQMLRLVDVQATPDGFFGHVTDLAYEGLADVPVQLARAAGGQTLATTTTQAGGVFTFPQASVEWLEPREDLEVVARLGEQEARQRIPVATQVYQPVRFRPLPSAVAELGEHALSLNGSWRIDPAPAADVRNKPLDAPGWGEFRVPGQWAQQGYDIPQVQRAALAREFTIPAAWAGYRIFLRFDAMHGGSEYWLNGTRLGYSENLFTPVEWEITAAARPGQTNRLDMTVLVATRSEELSKSSFYAAHALGGIDRDVRIFALPKLHIAGLTVSAGLDEAYRHGELQLELRLNNAARGTQTDLEAVIELWDATGRAVSHSKPKRALEPLTPGQSTVRIASHVADPLKWNAEHPNLYKLILELRQAGRLIERVERYVGFRMVEIKDRQLYVNGVRVKLAGVCRHEIDPLTGRAETKRHAERDVRLFKSANLNHVRTAHYPCTQEFLDAADRLGLYVELEAPLHWIHNNACLDDLGAAFTPVSAMIDGLHAHPSVIIYSLANESSWNHAFDLANKLCKQLDPPRPTTFNFFDGVQQPPHALRENCDIVNRHYPKMPFDKVVADDPRPLLIGECFFEVYHERTDVTINPGLRELWAHGNAEPDSAWGKFCTTIAAQPTHLRAGVFPGAWSHIYASERVIGSEIWSGIDDIAFLPGGKLVSCEQGNARWGLIDGWRRAKPELWLSKMVFAPVWFLRRQVDYAPGQTNIRVPVENRYAFTDFSELTFTWERDGATGDIAAELPPGARGELVIPVPQGTLAGKKLLVRATDAEGELVGGATITLGAPRPIPLSRPRAGAPQWSDDGKTIIIEGRRFTFVLDRAKGDFDAQDPRHKSPLVTFPTLHVTRMDFGDIGLGKPPFAEFPDAATRVVESVTAVARAQGLEITIKDRYDQFAGSVRWILDADGVGEVSYDYTYSGAESLETREVGLESLVRPACDEVRWRRWSEWGDLFPADHISRTAGRAKARRDERWPEGPPNVRPEWPWSLDETELGTNDFRAIKFNIYNAALVAADSGGVGVNAAGDVHFRACLAENGVKMHLLSQCTLGPVTLDKGHRLSGKFALRLMDDRETEEGR